MTAVPYKIGGQCSCSKAQPTKGGGPYNMPYCGKCGKLLKPGG
jgi:hypothetical protein